MDISRFIFGCIEVESTNHIFYSCKFSNYVWFRIFQWLRISSNIHIEVANLFINFASTFDINASLDKLISCIWYVTSWKIWKARNNNIFINLYLHPDSLMGEVKSLSWRWLKYKPKGLNHPLGLWMTNMRACLILWNLRSNYGICLLLLKYNPNSHLR